MALSIVKRMLALGCILAFFMLVVEVVEADLPVHCVHSQVLGEWSFHRGAGQQEKENLKCSQAPERYDRRLMRWGLGEPNFDPADVIKVELQEPNVVKHVDADGTEHTGTWTMIYDEGFEVNIRDHKYFAFAYFRDGPRCDDSSSCMTRRSVCHVTFPGWYHNAKNPDGKSWGCYYGAKTIKGEETEHTEPDTTELMQMPYKAEDELVARINLDSKQTWKARIYPEFMHKTMREMHQMGGGKRYHPPSYLAGAFLQEGQSGSDPDPDVSDVPESHDWRHHNGENYIGEVMNQGSCGSCYAVAVTHMLEARVRIKTKNEHKPKLSIQEALSCSEYAQGCHGGFPYLVAKYAQDYGMVDNAAMPYKGHKNVQCAKGAKSKVRATNYGYVGGYYGACNHDKMLRELYDHGPIVVGFDTDAGLWHYSEGMYDADSLLQLQDHPQGWGEAHGTRLHNHWEKTTHAVLVVGFGQGQEGKYWLVQNSWGPNWGEAGYFKIKRGVDHCAFESMAVRATPVLGTDEYFQSKASKSELGEVDELRYEPPAPKKKKTRTDADDGNNNIDSPALDIPAARERRELGENSEDSHLARAPAHIQMRRGEYNPDPEESQKEHPAAGTKGWFSTLMNKVDHSKGHSINDLEKQDTQELNDGFEVPNFAAGSEQAW
jgi:cathepsin C